MTEKVVYLHGFASGPGSSKARFFAGRLRAAGHEVEIPDLARGDFERLTITGQLEEVARAAAGEPCLLMGSSMGGYLAALYAARHPEVAAVILMAPAFGFARRWAESLGSEKLAEWRRTGWLEVFHYAEQAPRRLSYALLEDGASYEDYPDVRQPALVFHGRRDPVVPAAYSEEFATLHPNVSLVVFDSGHELTDALEPMWERVREFLTPRTRETRL